MKKLMILILTILIMLSIIHDLNRQLPTQNAHEHVASLDILHIKVKHGETVLSITEANNDGIPLDSYKVITDFKALNPGSNPENIVANQLYYFPLYNTTR